MFLAYSPTREDSESFNILAKVATSVQGELSPTTQQEGGTGCTPLCHLGTKGEAASSPNTAAQLLSRTGDTDAQPPHLQDSESCLHISSRSDFLV